MIHIALYEPEIPPNTGNIIRLVANMGAVLHIIQPMAFELDDKQCRRAGLDYREWARVQLHDNFDALQQALPDARFIAATTKASECYSKIHYRHGDCLLFGPESRGLPAAIRECCIGARIPMQAHSRSLNLANSVGIIAYEAWRQLGFRPLNTDIKTA